MAELTRIIDGKKIIIHLTHDELVMIGHEYFDNRAKEDISIYLETKESGNLSERDMQFGYSCAMKSHFRKFGNQMSGSGNHLCNYASLLA